MNKGMLPLLENDRGSILLISYFVIVMFIGIGSAFMILSTNESRVAQYEELATVAFHIAEAGVEQGLYDLRLDFINASGTPSWADGDINGHTIGPNSVNYYAIPYSTSESALNDGSFFVELKNVSTDDIWVRSTGTISGVSHTIEVYVRMVDLSPWNNVIFAGAGAAGTMVNGNVDIRGSVHILGNGLSAGDFAVDLGGTAEIVGNNYKGLDPALESKVPALPTTVVSGETVETLYAELRVKKGLVGLSGSSTVGEADIFGNSEKETVDGVYVTDGWGGNQGAASAYSDNGTSNAYDLGDSVAFPSLSDPYPGYSSYQAYLQDNALVIDNSTAGNAKAELAAITPNSNFSFSNANGSISMDGNGNMTVSGIVYIDDSGEFNLSKAGSDKTINYTGSGSIVAEGNVQIDVNLTTPGNNSFPNVGNIMGVMTPQSIGFNEASIDVMGLFYAETSVVVQKQTDIMGTIVSNYFDMGTNVPSIYQVPETKNYLPPGMIGSNSLWYLVVAWIKS